MMLQHDHLEFARGMRGGGEGFNISVLNMLLYIHWFIGRAVFTWGGGSRGKEFEPVKYAYASVSGYIFC